VDLYSGPEATRLSVRLTPNQARKLHDMARATRRNSSDLVRLLIESAEADSRPQVKVSMQEGDDVQQ
jgi:predicted transcriptional regulator